MNGGYIYDQLTGQWLSRQNYQYLSNYDIPTSMAEGWKFDRSYYGSDGMQRGQHRDGDYVVTRPHGYVPYQSVVQPYGRYAYNPNQDQYPRRRDEERASGRTALLPQVRQFEFTMNRSDNYVHRPGEVVTMGIDYDQMPTAVVPPPQQPMLDQYGRPTLPPGFVAPQGLLGHPQTQEIERAGTVGVMADKDDLLDTKTVRLLRMKCIGLKKLTELSLQIEIVLTI